MPEAHRAFISYRSTIGLGSPFNILGQFADNRGKSRL
jgi:hypothetical protein